MGWKTIKMERNLCSSTPWFPLYPYTMFQNPIPTPSCHKSRKPSQLKKYLSHKVLTQFIVISIPKNPYVQIFKPFWTLCPCTNWCFFFHFLSGGVKQTAKLFTFCWFWLGNMHQNGLSGTYLGFEACQIQWCRFWVSTIRGSWKIKISGKNFTFCSFWLEKNASEWLKWHVFRVSGMPNPMAQVSSLYDKQFLKNQNFRRQVA